MLPVERLAIGTTYADTGWPAAVLEVCIEKGARTAVHAMQLPPLKVSSSNAVQLVASCLMRAGDHGLVVVVRELAVLHAKARYGWRKIPKPQLRGIFSTATSYRVSVNTKDTKHQGVTCHCKVLHHLSLSDSPAGSSCCFTQSYHDYISARLHVVPVPISHRF
jgi:hypothetical protein